jgi:hypothetical protein
MMSGSKRDAKPVNIIDNIIDFMETFTKRWRDDADFTSGRLKAIEDRLAKLDYGYASDEAKNAALFEVNDARSVAGGRPLSFRFANGKREWDEFREPGRE